MPSSSPLPRNTDSAVDVAAILDRKRAEHPDAPALTEGERLAVTAALEGAAEAVAPVVRGLAADCKRLRNALEQLDGNVGHREQAIITQTLRPPASVDQQGAA